MKRKNVYVLVVAISLILLSTLSVDSTLGGRIANIVTIITAIIGAGALFVQFQRDKKINEHHLCLI